MHVLEEFVEVAGGLLLPCARRLYQAHYRFYPLLVQEVYCLGQVV